MSKKTDKKAVAAIIKKYIGTPQTDDLKKKVSSTVGWTSVFTLFDLAMTGGVTTATIATFAAVHGGLNGLSHLEHRSALGKKVRKENTAGQSVKAPKTVHMTLEKMEGQLKAAFFEVVHADRDLDKKFFLLLAQEVREDVKKLSSAFEIVSGSEHAGIAQYEFIVHYTTPYKFDPNPGRKTENKFLTLTHAIELLNKVEDAPKALSEARKEIQKLKQKIEAIENPKPIVLDKKPPPKKKAAPNDPRPGS